MQFKFGKIIYGLEEISKTLKNKSFNSHILIKKKVKDASMSIYRKGF